ncbi:MAG: xanthine dehydrogenase accessory protein XdhC [Rhizobium sp.]|nr:xanthine dehydrogenase accessory protein XdhC [Rhizobium sp.]
MTFDDFLLRSVPIVLADITVTKGSTPREAGTFMIVSSKGLWGTIGGGNLEFAAIDRARAILAGQQSDGMLTFTLGPDSGQCCGGVVDVRLTTLDPAGIEAVRARYAEQQRQQPDVFIFGAGHVGHALAAALAPLPLRVVMVETRENELDGLPPEIETRLVAMPESLVAEIRPGGGVVILTHDHALDFLIAAEALKRSDLAYVGMIGSKTKRGVFAHHLARQGVDRSLMDRLVLPIGGNGVRDKRPEVIAALVAAELLTAILGPPVA